MGFFPLLNRKEDIGKKFGNQTVDVAIDFYSFFFYTMEVDGYRQL